MGKQYLFSNRDLRRLIVPLFIEQFLAIFVGLADSIMVASVGEAAVSAVSLIDTIMVLLINMFTALATGGAIVAGQALGRKREEEGCEAAEQTLLFSTLFSLVIMAVVYAGKWFILHVVFGDIEPEVMENCTTYLLIVTASIPFLSIYNTGAAMFRAMGDSKTPMKMSLVMNGMNLVGNAILLYGFGFGVEGAAIPTTVSRVFAGIWMLFWMKNPQKTLHIRTVLGIRLKWRVLKQILHIGIPYSLENSMFQLGKILVQSLVSSLGTVSIAGFAVASNLVQFEYLPGTAIGLGIVTVIGQCVGAGEHEQAKQYTKYLLKINYGILAVLAVLLAALSAPLVSIYNLSPGAASIAVELIVVHSFAMVVWPISFALPNALRAATDVKFTMLTSIFSMWAFRIGLSYVLVLWANMGVMGVWVAMFADWVFRAILFFIRFCSGRWLHAIQKKVQPAAG